MKTLLLCLLALAAPLLATPEQDAIAARKLRNASDPITNAAEQLKRLKAEFPPATKKMWQKKFEYTAPDAAVWADLRSTVQTATLESLPRSLQLVEARVAKDREDIRKFLLVARQPSSRSDKAHESLAWYDSTLAPYLAELRALNPGR